MVVSVYFISHPEGFTKIGQSTRPKERFNDIRTYSPYELELETIITDGSNNSNTGSLEQAFHTYYDNYRTRGEWFELPDGEIESLYKFGKVRAKEVNHAMGRRKPNPDGVNVPLGELLSSCATMKWDVG